MLLTRDRFAISEFEKIITFYVEKKIKKNNFEQERPIILDPSEISLSFTGFFLEKHRKIDSKLILLPTRLKEPQFPLAPTKPIDVGNFCQVTAELFE